MHLKQSQTKSRSSGLDLRLFRSKNFPLNPKGSLITLQMLTVPCAFHNHYFRKQSHTGTYFCSNLLKQVYNAGGGGSSAHYYSEIFISNWFGDAISFNIFNIELRHALEQISNSNNILMYTLPMYAEGFLLAGAGEEETYPKKNKDYKLQCWYCIIYNYLFKYLVLAKLWLYIFLLSRTTKASASLRTSLWAYQKHII